jgi:pilus assembly protein CpaF
MFGKRSDTDQAPKKVVEPADQPSDLPAVEPAVTAPVPVAKTVAKPAAKPAPPQTAKKTDEYYDVKTQIFGALIDTIDLSQLAKMDSEQAREEIRDIVNDIITVKNVVLSISEQEELLEDICNDVLGYGGTAPVARRHRRYHGQRRRHDLYRSRRQGAGNQCPVPRQRAVAQCLPAHR